MEFSNFYTKLNNLNGKELFKFIVMFILVLSFFNKLNITLSMFVGILIGSVIVYYNYSKYEANKSTEDNLIISKHQNIHPTPIEDIKNYPDIIDFIFSIQEMRIYAPQNWEEMILNINSFIRIHADINLGDLNCYENYEIAENKMNNATNALHSIIFGLQASPEVLEKHNRSHKKLHQILHNYLKEIYKICQRKIIKKGYDNTTKIINHTGPKAYNYYLLDKSFTYDVY